MFTRSLVLTFLLIVCGVNAYTQSTSRITTPWTSRVDATNPLPEYPRPQLVRDTWMNLNGAWDYAIAARGGAQPTAYAGRIVVPYPVESTLSSVGKTVGKDPAAVVQEVIHTPAQLQRQKRHPKLRRRRLAL